MKKLLLLSVFMLATFFAKAGDTARVLFIGNSFTATNNMPQMLQSFAQSLGDWVEYETVTPGGATFQNHVANTTTRTKLAAGGWDYVVLQEQSQLPAMRNAQVASDVYPYARQLDSMARAGSPCAETIFFMTWGYRNGDVMNCPSFPTVCTYYGMDSLIRKRYSIMADSNAAVLAPVGAVWRHLGSTVDLYQTDQMHPSIAGSYAAAASFYSVIFRKDPMNATFTSSLDSLTAAMVRDAAKMVAYDSLAYWNVGAYDPFAAFSHSATGRTVNFVNNSASAASYQWQFGDGASATSASPTHTYASAGTYNVRLIASRCGMSDTVTRTITVTGGSNSINAASGGMIARIFTNEQGTRLFVDAGNSKLPGIVSVRAITGQVVMQMNITPDAGRQGIDISGIAAGSYIVTLEQSAQQAAIGRISIVR